MYNIRKGSLISETMYGMTIVSTITSEIELVNEGTQQQFTAKTERGSEVEYLLGGAYGASIQILEY